MSQIPGIKKLSIHGLFAAPAQPLAALREMPRLEELDMTGMMDNDRSALTDLEGFVHLRVLHLEEPTSRYAPYRAQYRALQKKLAARRTAP